MLDTEHIPLELLENLPTLERAQAAGRDDIVELEILDGGHDSAAPAEAGGPEHAPSRQTAARSAEEPRAANAPSPVKAPNHPRGHTAPPDALAQTSLAPHATTFEAALVAMRDNMQTAMLKELGAVENAANTVLEGLEHELRDAYVELQRLRDENESLSLLRLNYERKLSTLRDALDLK